MNTETNLRGRYALAPHVFLCVAGDDLVVLDLMRDKYLSIAAPDAARLSAMVNGWPALPQTHQPADQSEPATLADALVGRGVLTTDIGAGKDAAPVRVPEILDEVTADTVGRQPRTRAADLAVVVKSCILGKWLRRNRSIEHIVARVRCRRDRAGLRAHTFDLETARRLIVLFGSLRAYFFSTRDACLMEAIVLLEIFAHYGLYPSWVFGVKTRPFVAHCWLQHESVVLNDARDRVGDYQPIMLV